MRGDLQEGHFYDSRCHLPIFPSTKSAFLCAFGVRNPCFRAFRAQNRHFCALLGSGTPVFGCFEHKIEVFVLFWGLEPSFSGFLSTKSGFLCSRGGESGIGKRNRGDPFHFAAAPTPSHQRTRTPAPAHQLQRTGTGVPTPAHPPSNGPQQWYQAPSSAVKCCPGAV